MTRGRFEHQGTTMLFPTPLLSYRVADADQINAQLLQEVAQRRVRDPDVKRSGRGGWHSRVDFFERPEPGHRALAAAIRGAVEDATIRMSGDATFFQRVNYRINGWINVNPQHAYNVPHDHPGSYWSGCYYAAIGAAEAGAGAISFIDPRCAPTGQALVRAEVFPGAHSVVPVPGMLLLFPGNAKHWVQPNGCEEDRVTVAFNVAFGGGAAA